MNKVFPSGRITADITRFGTDATLPLRAKAKWGLIRYLVGIQCGEGGVHTLEGCLTLENHGGRGRD